METTNILPPPPIPQPPVAIDDGAILRADIHVVKRDGQRVVFSQKRITGAIAQALCAERGLDGEAQLVSEDVQRIADLSTKVCKRLRLLASRDLTLSIHVIQDEIEDQMMKEGLFAIARRYILYREEHRKVRLLRGKEPSISTEKLAECAQMIVVLPDGSRESFDYRILENAATKACTGLEDRCSVAMITGEVIKMLYTGVTAMEIDNAMIFAAKTLTEIEPDYTYVAARILLKRVQRQVLKVVRATGDVASQLQGNFAYVIADGIEAGIYDARLAKFDLERLSFALRIDRDLNFSYPAMHQLVQSALIKIDAMCIETPQYMWMRIAMGLALHEEKPTEVALSFYEVLSNFDVSASSAMMRNAGTPHASLFTCIGTTVDDDLENVAATIGDNLKLAAYGSGVSNNWSRLRAAGSNIFGVSHRAAGISPFVRTVAATADALRGDFCDNPARISGSLVLWHADIETILQGRCADGAATAMTYAVPDLFMRRLKQGELWTLFDPKIARNLLTLSGIAFDEAYERLELQKRGTKTLPAGDLWKGLLDVTQYGDRLVFCDAVQARAMNAHQGTEVAVDASATVFTNGHVGDIMGVPFIALNFVNHIDFEGIDTKKMANTCKVAMRLLDNCIDLNRYASKRMRTYAVDKRSVALGGIGFQDALFKLNLSYDSKDAIDFADLSAESLAFYSVAATVALAEERGAYRGVSESNWVQQGSPLGSLASLERQRGDRVDVNRQHHLNWKSIRDQISKMGLRNSQLLALMPTPRAAVTLSLTADVQPLTQNTCQWNDGIAPLRVWNRYLVDDLKALGLWDHAMIRALLKSEGALESVSRIPEAVKEKYRFGCKLSRHPLLDCAARRQKWIDMGQSVVGRVASVEDAQDFAMQAWRRGLKSVTLQMPQKS